MTDYGAVSLFRRLRSAAEQRWHPVRVHIKAGLGAFIPAVNDEAGWAAHYHAAEQLVEEGEDFLAVMDKHLPRGRQYPQCPVCKSLYCLATLPASDPLFNQDE